MQAARQRKQGDNPNICDTVTSIICWSLYPNAPLWEDPHSLLYRCQFKEVERQMCREVMAENDKSRQERRERGKKVVYDGEVHGGTAEGVPETTSAGWRGVLEANTSRRNLFWRLKCVSASDVKIKGALRHSRTNGGVKLILPFFSSLLFIFSHPSKIKSGFYDSNVISLRSVDIHPSIFHSAVNRSWCVSTHLCIDWVTSAAEGEPTLLTPARISDTPFCHLIGGNRIRGRIYRLHPSFMLVYWSYNLRQCNV